MPPIALNCLPMPPTILLLSLTAPSLPSIASPMPPHHPGVPRCLLTAPHYPILPPHYRSLFPRRPPLSPIAPNNLPLPPATPRRPPLFLAAPHCPHCLSLPPHCSSLPPTVSQLSPIALNCLPLPPTAPHCLRPSPTVSHRPQLSLTAPQVSKAYLLGEQPTLDSVLDDWLPVDKGGLSAAFTKRALILPILSSALKLDHCPSALVVILNPASLIEAARNCENDLVKSELCVLFVQTDGAARTLNQPEALNVIKAVLLRVTEISNAIEPDLKDKMYRLIGLLQFDWEHVCKLRNSLEHSSSHPLSSSSSADLTFGKYFFVLTAMLFALSRTSDEVFPLFNHSFYMLTVSLSLCLCLYSSRF